MHKEGLGLRFLVFVCVAIFCYKFNKTADRTKMEPFPPQEKKYEGR